MPIIIVQRKVLLVAGDRRVSKAKDRKDDAQSFRALMPIIIFTLIVH